MLSSLRRSSVSVGIAFALTVAFGLSACADKNEKTESSGTTGNDAFPSTYKALPSTPTLITNAMILIGNGERIDNGQILLQDGKVVAVGSSLDAPDDVVLIDAKGRYVTPGIIDVHSHLGVYPNPGVDANSDGNEAVAPDTSYAYAEHGIWPHDPTFNLARAGGVTAMMILPGSANLFGGRSVTVKNIPAGTMQEMKFPNAPYGLKMACGENPKRVYGEKGGPQTRMGNVAGYRKSWIEAGKYLDDWNLYNEALAKANGDEQAVADKKPERDLRLETLAGVLKGEILVQNHCYRAEEMAVMLDVAKEFGYKVTMFHHAIEAYKVADLLAENGVCAAMWADWWGFKNEAYDMVFENIALVDRVKNGCAVVHSDSPIGIQHLNQEAAKAMAAGNRAGIAIKAEQAIKWLTLNAAKSIGVDAQTGSLETGKMADVVIWNRDPFSVYALADQVFVDGALVFDRFDKKKQAVSDFELGIVDATGERL